MTRSTLASSMTTPTTATPPAQEARNLLKSLQDKFQVFRDYMPLAIGIDKQLLAQEADLNRKILRLALGMHTNSFRYLKSMESAKQRFNLDGSDAGEVPEEHRKHASEILRERFKKEVARRKAQKEAEAQERQRAEKLDQLMQKFGKKN
jgi:ProP effector